MCSMQRRFLSLLPRGKVAKFGYSFWFGLDEDRNQQHDAMNATWYEEWLQDGKANIFMSSRTPHDINYDPANRRRGDAPTGLPPSPIVENNAATGKLSLSRGWQMWLPTWAHVSEGTAVQMSVIELTFNHQRTPR